MYVKFIDVNTIENAPKFLIDDKNTYANPLPETLIKFGYKPLVETDCPNEEGYTYTFEYNETEDQVVKTWVAHEIVIEPEPESEPELVQEPETPVEEPELVDTDLDTNSEQVSEQVSEQPETPAENVPDNTESGQENVQELEEPVVE